MRTEAAGLIATMLLTSACVTSSQNTDNSTSPVAPAVLIDTYEEQTPSTREFAEIHAFIGAFREAYKDGDILPLLTPDFRFLEVRSDQQIRTVSRLEFAGLRARDAKNGAPPQIRTTVQAAHVGSNNATVVLKQQYTGAIFAPVFDEKMRLRRKDGDWAVDLMASILSREDENGQPLHASARIFVLRDFGETEALFESNKTLREFADEEGISRLENFLITHDVSKMPATETRHKVIFAFVIPPQPGTEIRIEHQFRRSGSTGLRPYVVRYRKVEIEPYLLFVNNSQAGGSGGSITYSIFVDDKLVGRRSLPII